jgi:ethanolamine ammonia-lyase large subunit
VKYQHQNKVDELLRRAGATLDGIAKEGSREPDVDAQVALADITLATALMQYEVTYRVRPTAPERAA